MVVETMKKEHLSIHATMQEFGINDHKIIERWERIYLEEGPEGLAIERRGRSSKDRPPKQLPKQVEEDLLADAKRKGNQLLEYLMDTDVRFMDTDSYDDIYAEMDRVGKASGKKYYKIPCGGSNAIGALGYVNCMKEIVDTGMHFDYVYCAEGSGGTHVGVALGAMFYMPQTKTVGLMVDSDPFEVITTNIMQETAKLLELDFTPTAENVHLIDMCGPGYAIPSPEGNAAIRMMAENEGLFLDPVYTGKAFAGLVKMAREGQFKPTDNVLYLYSGGTGGLFAIDIELD